MARTRCPTVLAAHQWRVLSTVDLGDQFAFIFEGIADLEEEEPSKLLKILQRILGVVVCTHPVGCGLNLGLEFGEGHASTSDSNSTDWTVDRKVPTASAPPRTDVTPSTPPHSERNGARLKSSLLATSATPPRRNLSRTAATNPSGRAG